MELFAGVGGFRIGFEGPPGSADRSGARVVWANQWEPTTKKQHAAEVYAARFGSDGFSNRDIEKVIEDDFDIEIADEDVDLVNTVGDAVNLITAKL